MGVTNESELSSHTSSTSCKKCYSQSQSVFSPLKSKMLKNIRQRFRTDFHTAPGTEHIYLQPIRFNSIHGDNIILEKDRSIARRKSSFNKAITFSDRPIKCGEKIHIKVLELSHTWNGSIRFGLTSHNPITLKDRLPKYACPDLTNLEGFWGRAVEEKEFARLNSTMYFYLNRNGNVYYGIEGKSKFLLLDNVNVSRPLWMMIDIYGNTNAIEIVNQQLNNFVPTSQKIMYEMGNHNNYGNVDSSDSLIYTQAEISHLSLTNDDLNVQGSVSIPYITCSVTKHLEQLKNNNQQPQNIKKNNKLRLILTPLPFHDKCGVNVSLSDDKLMGTRLKGRYTKGYLFSSRTMESNEFLVVQILKSENCIGGGMTFGMTTKNPSSIDPKYLPEDSDDLIDSAESFFVHKDVAHSPREGDILIFSMTPEGEVRMKKYNDHEFTVFHVEKNLPYWWFIDLFGSTVQVRTYSGIAEKLTQENIQQVHDAAESNTRGVSYTTTLSRNRSFVQTETASTIIFNYNVQGNENNTKSINITVQNQGICQASTNMEVQPKRQSVNLQTQLYEDELNSSSTQNDCIVCCERPVDCVLYRCGHMCMCYKCARELWRGRGDGHCPYCRAIICDVVRTYKS